MKDKKFVCIVCLKEVKDITDHVIHELNVIKDPKHILFSEMNQANSYKNPCFCGGTISTYGSGPDSWETSCNSCHFVWDED